MIKAALKTYFKNSKYIFIAMGLIYLVVILMLFLLVKGVVTVVSTVSKETYENLANFVVDTFNGVTFDQITSLQFYKDFLKGITDILKTDIQNAKKMLVAVAVIAVACVLAAITGSQILCRSLMRKTTADEKSIRGVGAMLVRYVVSLFFGYMLVYLNYLWKYSFIFVLLLYFVHNAFENLFTTWIIHFREYKINDIFNVHNSIKLVLSDFILIAVNVAIVLILYLIMGGLFAVLIAMPLLAYTFAVFDLIAVSHFRNLQAKGQLHLREKKNKKQKANDSI